MDRIGILRKITKEIEKSIACHNPCYLTKQGIPLSEQLLDKCVNVEEALEDYCVAGGGVYFTNPELSKEVGKKTAELFNSEEIICGCPFCKEQLEMVNGKERKISHYVELWDNVD